MVFTSLPCTLCAGTPEIGGLTVIQAMEIVRGCKGLNIIGADLVEVSVLIMQATLLQGQHKLLYSYKLVPPPLHVPIIIWTV